MHRSTLVVTTPAATRDLTTLARLKAELSITDSLSDTLLTNIIREASEAIGSYCSRPEGFGAETVTETFWLTDAPYLDPTTRGQDVLILARDLVPTIASVTEDGTALVANTAYLLDGSVLCRVFSGTMRAWTARQVVVAYSAGYALPGSVPNDLQRAALDLCASMWSSRGRDWTIRSEAVDGVGSVSYLDPRAAAVGLPPTISDRLASWRRINV
jgi:hypothetical protein